MITSSQSTPLASRVPVDVEGKRGYNRALFAVVAPRYWTATRVLSLGRDQGWKEDLVAALPDRGAPTILDVATGTGDIAARLLQRFPEGFVLGVDLSSAMLGRARVNVQAVNAAFGVQDMHQLGLKTGSVDLLTGGYALRNAPDHLRALGEMHRVLKPGGCLALLDFVHFSHPLMWRLEYLVLKLWGSLWGALLHRNPGVYRYIAESLRDFPDRRAFYRLLDGYGFDVLSSRRYLFGIVERVCARKR